MGKIKRKWPTWNKLKMNVPRMCHRMCHLMYRQEKCAMNVLPNVPSNVSPIFNFHIWWELNEWKGSEDLRWFTWVEKSRKNSDLGENFDKRKSERTANVPWTYPQCATFSVFGQFSWDIQSFPQIISWVIIIQGGRFNVPWFVEFPCLVVDIVFWMCRGCTAKVSLVKIAFFTVTDSLQSSSNGQRNGAQAKMLKSREGLPRD